MRSIIALFAVAVALNLSLTSCKSDTGPTAFCEPGCLRDSIKFVKEDHPYKPYVYISADDCMADTLTWSYIDMGMNKKLGIEDMLGIKVQLDKENVGCFIQDTSYAWLRFNDCSNGRGFLVKLPFNKTAKIGIKSSALNSFDPKFSVAEGLIAYSDRGNLFVEEMATGKTAMMTFGQRVEIDYNKIHDKIDSINVTPTRIWANVKMDKDWKTFEKKITLQ